MHAAEPGKNAPVRDWQGCPCAQSEGQRNRWLKLSFQLRVCFAQEPIYWQRKVQPFWPWSGREWYRWWRETVWSQIRCCISHWRAQGVYKHGRKEVWQNHCLPPTSMAFEGKKSRFYLGILTHGFAFYAFLGPYETQTSKNSLWWCGHIRNIPSCISCGCVNSAVTCSSMGEGRVQSKAGMPLCSS